MSQWAYHWLYQDFWAPVWPNLAASLVVAAFVTAKVNTLRRLHEEHLVLQARHHQEHMQALNPDTPGGLAAVMSEVKDARVAAETASEAMKLLTVALAPKTPMAKKAPRKDGAV